MPRYFFHISGLSTFNDTVGAELKDVSAAWSVAIVSFGEILMDIDGKMPDRSEIRITVKDEDERVVAVVRFTGERDLAEKQAKALLPNSGPEGARDRMAAAFDATLDWIKDVHDPVDYGLFAFDLADAAMAVLEEGDLLARGLHVARKTMQ